LKLFFISGIKKLLIYGTLSTLVLVALVLGDVAGDFRAAIAFLVPRLCFPVRLLHCETKGPAEPRQQEHTRTDIEQCTSGQLGLRHNIGHELGEDNQLAIDEVNRCFVEGFPPHVLNEQERAHRAEVEQVGELLKDQQKYSKYYLFSQGEHDCHEGSSSQQEEWDEGRSSAFFGNVKGTDKHTVLPFEPSVADRLLDNQFPD